MMRCSSEGKVVMAVQRVWVAKNAIGERDETKERYPRGKGEE